MTEANKDNCSLDGENADFSMEDFAVLFVADDAAGVVDEVLEIPPREDFLTLILAGWCLKWCSLQLVRKPGECKLTRVGFSTFSDTFSWVAKLCVWSNTTVCSWEILAAEKSSSGKPTYEPALA